MRILRSSRFWLIVILIVAAAVRFYRLPEYMQFLGDEGRDVLIVKRMIVDHKFTLLGPTMSVAGFYVGPIYYYFMIPFLWAFQLNPVGPAVMAVLFGVATVWAVYYFCKIYLNPKVSLIAALLLAFSPKAINISRFSWNPNPIPFFTLLVFILLFNKRIISHFFIGICLGILTQLHYTTLVVGLIAGVIILLTTSPKSWLKTFLVIFSGFVISNIPLILFDVRHNFVNTKGVLEFLTRDSAVAKQFDYVWAFRDVFRRLYEAVFGTQGLVLDLIRYVSVAGLVIWSILNIKKSKVAVVVVFVWFFVGIMGIGAYRGQLEEHYFAYLFPTPFIILGILLNHKSLLIIPAVALCLFIEISNLPFWRPPSNVVAQTKMVDERIATLVGNEPYNFALISKGNSDHAYRYFLEVWGKAPVVIESPFTDPQRTTVTKQLVVVCEGPCGPLGHSLWEVAGFGRAEIAYQEDVTPGITLYKLIHYVQ